MVVLEKLAELKKDNQDKNDQIKLILDALSLTKHNSPPTGIPNLKVLDKYIKFPDIGTKDSDKVSEHSVPIGKTTLTTMNVTMNITNPEPAVPTTLGNEGERALHNLRWELKDITKLLLLQTWCRDYKNQTQKLTKCMKPWKKS